eukprot:677695-Rhodomonas_salina.1
MWVSVAVMLTMRSHRPRSSSSSSQVTASLLPQPQSCDGRSQRGSTCYGKLAMEIHTPASFAT